MDGKIEIDFEMVNVKGVQVLHAEAFHGMPTRTVKKKTLPNLNEHIDDSGPDSHMTIVSENEFF